MNEVERAIQHIQNHLNGGGNHELVEAMTLLEFSERRTLSVLGEAATTEKAASELLKELMQIIDEEYPMCGPFDGCGKCNRIRDFRERAAKTEAVSS